MKKSRFITVLRLENKANEKKKKYRLSTDEARKASLAHLAAYRALSKARDAMYEPGASGSTDDAEYAAMIAADKALGLSDLASIRLLRSQSKMQGANYDLANKLYHSGPIRRKLVTKRHHRSR
jgi:hypothetical protein